MSDNGNNGNNGNDGSYKSLDSAAAKREKKRVLRKIIRSRVRAAYADHGGKDKLVEESNRVFDRLLGSSVYRQSRSVGFFLSMPNNEIQTREAIDVICRKDGKTLFVPKVGLDFEKCDMDLVRVVLPDACQSADADAAPEMFYDRWPKNKWGIPEPPIAEHPNSAACSSSSPSPLIARPGDIDLLIVPGLAFDSRGRRLGQGKGYYDRFISKMRSTNQKDEHVPPKPLLAGVCLQQQYLNLGISQGHATHEKTNDEPLLQNALEYGGIPTSDHDYDMDMVITPDEMVIISPQLKQVLS